MSLFTFIIVGEQLKKFWQGDICSETCHINSIVVSYVSIFIDYVYLNISFCSHYPKPKNIHLGHRHHQNSFPAYMFVSITCGLVYKIPSHVFASYCHTAV